MIARGENRRNISADRLPTKKAFQAACIQDWKKDSHRKSILATFDETVVLELSASIPGDVFLDRNGPPTLGSTRILVRSSRTTRGDPGKTLSEEKAVDAEGMGHRTQECNCRLGETTLPGYLGLTKDHRDIDVDLGIPRVGIELRDCCCEQHLAMEWKIADRRATMVRL